MEDLRRRSSSIRNSNLLATRVNCGVRLDIRRPSPIVALTLPSSSRIRADLEDHRRRRDQPSQKCPKDSVYEILDTTCGRDGSIGRHSEGFTVVVAGLNIGDCQTVPVHEDIVGGTLCGIKQFAVMGAACNGIVGCQVVVGGVNGKGA